ncbi:MAG: galactose-1-phosphate uridylyltransferase [Chloroflexi bacterium]|nr:galactose-1-phosphate uridylyltransferase [Chloroflexota bacterium]
MSERRWNPVLGEWVITATHRQDRTFLPPADYCPLDPTRPGGHPTEIDRADFEIVVFENRFPSLRRDPPEPAVAGTELSPVERASGVCEVVVYTPEHEATLTSESLEHIRRLIAVWAHRTVVLGARPEVDYVFVFENKGEAIGVTLHHPHGQIYAYPTIPPVLEREVANARSHVRRTGRCLWCDLQEQELADGRRIVAETESWVAGVPFAARWPYEVHLLPRRHVGWLHELTAPEVDDLALTLKTVLLKYDALFGFSLPYIMAIHQRPTDGGNHESYHLHIEFLPPNRTESKLKYLAGSETAAGAFINDTLPEETAPRLRELEPRTTAEVPS